MSQVVPLPPELPYSPVTTRSLPRGKILETLVSQLLDVKRVGGPGVDGRRRRQKDDVEVDLVERR